MQEYLDERINYRYTCLKILLKTSLKNKCTLLVPNICAQIYKLFKITN